jgi:hypothetical protein
MNSHFDPAKSQLIPPAWPFFQVTHGTILPSTLTWVTPYHPPAAGRAVVEECMATTARQSQSKQPYSPKLSGLLSGVSDPLRTILQTLRTSPRMGRFDTFPSTHLSTSQLPKFLGTKYPDR